MVSIGFPIVSYIMTPGFCVPFLFCAGHGIRFYWFLIISFHLILMEVGHWLKWKSIFHSMNAMIIVHLTMHVIIMRF